MLRRIIKNGGCRIPLGHFNGITYSFFLTSSILQLQDKVQDQQESAKPAPAAYFCVQKQDLDQVRQLPWGGSSASPSQTYATDIARSLSVRSVYSKNSSYFSGNAHPVSECPPTISKDKVEEQAGFGLFGGRKASVQNCDRKLSLRSKLLDNSCLKQECLPSSRQLRSLGSLLEHCIKRSSENLINE